MSSNAKEKRVLRDLLLLFILVAFMALPIAIAEEVPAHVVISAVYPDAVNESASEWIELYNPTDKSVNIGGWTIDTATHISDATLPAGTTIAAHGFYLIADGGFSTGKDNPSWPDADLEDEIALRNGDGWCRLNNSGSIVDTVGWGTATTNETANADKPAQGESIERKSLNVGYAPCQDTDDNSIDFFVQGTSTPKNASSAKKDPAPVELFDAAGNFKGGFNKIQDAVNNASDGYTAFVHDGTYNENVDVTKSHLTIRSENGPSVTTVSASLNPDEHVFGIIDQINVTLRGFKIRDANGTSQGVAGIYMNKASECNISDNIVMNISATGYNDAYGIYLEDSSDNNSFDTSTVYNLSAANYNAYGIYLRSSSGNSFDTSTVYNLSAYNEAYGIYLYYSSDNSFDITTVYNLSGYDTFGIRLYSSSDNSFDTSTVYNLSANYRAYGILLYYSSDNNSFVTSTVYNLSANDDAYGILLYYSSDNNSFDTTTVYNISSANKDAFGIYLISSSDNNSFSSGSISDINAPTWWDFYSDPSSQGNSAENIRICSFPTTISFTYGNGIMLKSVETPPADPAYRQNISKYVNLTEVTAESWIFMNVSYEEGDLGGVDENSLRMWKHNGTDWTEVLGTNGVNTAENYVYANITEFSVFAPLGNVTGVKLEINKTGVPDPVSPGGTLNYTISVDNTGNATATNVTVKETYDGNVTFVAAVPAPSQGNDTWVFATLNVCETRWINISVIVNASVLNGTVLHNIVNVSCDEGVMDTDTENTTVFAAPIPVFEINKTSNPDPVPAGGTLNYSISVNNTGNATATNVTVMETYDVNVTFVTAVPAPSQGSDTWKFATLNVSGTKWINISVIVNASVLNGTVLHNIVNVTSDEGVMDSDTENTTVFVAPVPVLEITKADAPDPVSPGGTLNYSISVNNTGNATATNVTVKETYDGNVTLVTAVPAPSLGNDTWEFATLNASETRWINISVSINASVPNGTVLHNVVNVTCDEGVTDSDTEDTTVLFKELNCTCGDICVNETGWWRDGGVFNPCNTPIQHAIDNATAGDIICVKDGTYNENVDVTKSHLTIRSENGPLVTTVSASLYPDEHVFNITDQTNVTLEGFEIRDAHGTSQNVAGIYMYNASECNISNNIVTNISATGWPNAPYGIYLRSSSDNSFVTSTVYNISGYYDAYGIMLLDSSDNSFVTSTVYNISANDFAYGIRLYYSSDNSFDTTTVYNLSSAIGKAYGIRLYCSSDNSFDTSTSVYNLSANQDAYGIYLHGSSNNRFSSSTVYNLSSANRNAWGIYLSYSSNNRFSSSTTVYNLSSANDDAYGILLSHSSNNKFSSSTTVYNLSANNIVYGIWLHSSSNNRFSSSTSVYNLSANDQAYGIYLLYPSNNNSFSSGSISDINAPTWWDFYSDEDAHGNSAENITISSFPTTISFTYDNGIKLKSVATPPADPAGKRNISKYVNAVEVTAESWIFMNVSYEEGDLVGVAENSLRMWKHNGTDWTEVPGTNGVNTAENYVYANITEFSVFAPLGNVTGAKLEINKTDSPDPVSPGGTLNYSIHVNNTGNATATNVTVKETYDGNVTFVTAVPAPSQGNDTWKFTSLNVSETRWINISVIVNASVLNGTVLHNIVNVTCDKGVTDSDTEDTTVLFKELNCTCGDICVNETGWWQDGGAFIASGTPIQDAIDNAIAGETICVKDGTYHENVNVYKSLTIRTENGSASTTVQASNSNDHVFEVTADYVNISGFTMQNATVWGKAGICLGSVGHCNISDNNASNNNYGICLSYSDNNTLSGNNASNNNNYGICLSYSDNNTLTGNNASNNGGDGIHLYYSDNNTLTGNNASKNNSFGIYLSFSNNNTLTNNTASNNNYGILLGFSSGSTLTGNNASNNNYGIRLGNSYNNTFTDNTASNNRIGGIYVLWHSSSNTFTDNTASNNTLWWDFFSDESSHDNTIEDLTIASYPTTISFIYDNGIKLKGVDTAPDDPAGKANIGKYVNVTDVTADSWIFLNVSYAEGDLGGVDENSLRLWKHNGTDWTEVLGTNGVNTAENYVYANITEFSVFAPLGNVTGAKLEINKTGVPDPVSPGVTLNYTICVNNTGNATATNVTVKETYDGNVTFVGAVPAPSLGNDTWKFTSLNVSETRRINISVTVNASVPNETVLHNYVNVTCDEGVTDSDTENTTVFVAPVPVLEINKTGVPDPVSPGGALNYTIHVNNTGNATAIDVIVKETYDGNVTFIAAEPAPSSGDDTWQFPTLNVSETRWINVSVNVNASVPNGTVLHNIVNVTCDEGVTDTDTENTTVFVAPALPPNITSFAPPSPVNDTVCNWRTFNVTVDQTVNVSWYLNNTHQHTNVSTKEANYTLHAEVVGEHNVSAIASNENGSDMQSWVWNVTAAPLPVLEINKTDNPDPVSPGGTLNYSISVNNSGNATATNVTVKETYDANVTFIAAEPAPSSGDDTWQFATLNVSEMRWINVSVTVNVSVPNGTVLHNIVNVSCDEGVTGSDTENTTVFVAPVPELEITKTDAPDPVSPGGTLNYTIAVNNTGNATATNVTVMETYDKNVTFVAAVPAPSSGDDTWQFPTLNASETRWINISVLVNASAPNGTVLHNIVTVSCAEGVTDFDTADTTVLFKELNCTCGDICVNETGWWRDGGAFNPSNMPVQHAVDNATAGDTICVKDGTYNENVDVTKSHLTIRSENGPSVTTVSASLNPDKHVFKISDQTNVTLEGFEIRDATGTSQNVAGIYMSNACECNIFDNIVTNISATDMWNHAHGIWLRYSSDNSFVTTTVYNLDADFRAYGIYLSSSSDNSFVTTTVYNLSADDEADGIRLSSLSDNNSFDTSTVYNLSSANGQAFGILLEASSDNSFVTSTVYNLDANEDVDGIDLWFSSDNNSFDTTTVYNLSSANSVTYGIFIWDSSDNLFDTTTVYNLDAKYAAYGIRLSSSSDNNSFDTTTVYNLSADSRAYGIYLRFSSDNNSFSSGSISDINAPTWWDFYSKEDAHGNSAENIRISSFPTTISFTYENGIMLKSVATPPADPAGKRNISKYVNVTEVTADSWLFMNVSYEDGDLGGVEENSLRMWKHNGTDWMEVPGTNGVNTAENYVYAKITEFGSIFAPLGNVTGANLEINKTDNPDPVSPGGTLNYSIRVNNVGNATATNVTVTETYDENVTFVAAEPAPSSGDDSWQFPTLNVSETSWINISVSVNASVLNGTVLHNIVNVSCAEGVSDSDTENTTVFVVQVCVETATGTGNACFATDSGTIEDLVAVDESTLPEEGKPQLVFPHGFFSFNITGLTPGQTVVVTLTLPDNVPVGTEYWKYHAAEGGWIRIPMGSDDGDNEITITLVDGGLGDDDGTANGVIVDQGGPGVRATKPKLTKSAPTSVAPGGTITYTILYANLGPVALTDVTITENYPKGVTFSSAVPAPDAGTNNKWTIGTLPAGASGQIIIKVKVPDSRDLSFTETGSVTGEGFVMVSKDLSTEQKPYTLRNVVTISCAETDPVTASAFTTVTGVPGTSLEITEHGSGIYESEELLNFGTKNKSIRLQKSTDAEYRPTSFNFSDGFSVNFMNKWMQDICSKNMVMGDAMHKKIKHATYIKDETKTETGEYGTEMEFASSFQGAAHIGAVSKDVTTSEDYIGEFEIFWAAKEECRYLFNWSRVPGNDSEKLIRFLVDNLAITWAENATITKSNNDRIINLSTDWHSAEVILAADNETATVKVGNETIYVLDVRTEDGSLNVYDCRLRKISESVTGEGYVMVDKELTSGHILVVEHGSGIYSSDTDFNSQRLNKSTEAEYQPTTFNFSDGFDVNFSSKWMQDICSKDKKAGTAIHKKISNAATMKDDTTATKSSMAFETSFNGSIHVGARTTETRISEDYIGRFNVSQVIKIGDTRSTSTSTSNTSNSSDLPSCP